MTSKQPPCPIDGQPTRNSQVLCAACVDTLAVSLGDIPAVLHAMHPPRHLRAGEHGSQRSTPWDVAAGASGGLADDLITTGVRLSRAGASDGRGNAETAVPWDERAMSTLHAMTGTLAAWVSLVHDERRLADVPGLDLPSMARWLLPHVMWLASHESAADAYTEIVGVVCRARRAVDRRPDRWYAGRCGAPAGDGECERDLWVRPGAPTVRCGCGARWDVAERREWLLAAAEDQLLTATDAARAISVISAQPVTPERIRQWKARGRITAHSVDLRGRPLYRVGDVIDLAGEDARRRESA